jgi:CBS domain-containing protein
MKYPLGSELHRRRPGMTTTVEQVMSGSVVKVREDETLGEVRERMTSLDISALPVVSAEEVLVGIVTADDLVSGYETTLPVSRVMTTQVHTLSPGDDVVKAVRLMRDYRHHHVVVMDGQRVVGMLSSLDLLGLLE